MVLGKYTGDPAAHPQTHRLTPNEEAKKREYLIYAKMVGGTSVHFAANYWRFREIDFLEKTRKGALAGTSLDDWPITYADLEPYYTRAEWEVGVSGQAGVKRNDAPRSRPYPMPPLPIRVPWRSWKSVRRSLAGSHNRRRWRSCRVRTEAAPPV